MSRPPVPGAKLTRDQARSLFLHAAVAQEMRSRGTEGIEIARRNIAHMRSVNPHAAPLLDEWERILQGTIDQIIASMLDPSVHGQDLRQVTPFGGILTPAQRTDVYRQFGERWNSVPGQGPLKDITLKEMIVLDDPDRRLG